MNSYLEIALINAVITVPLALLAECAGRLFKRPALTHLLWVLILIKLVTPPVWQIPVVDRDFLTSVSHHLVPRIFPEADAFAEAIPFENLTNRLSLNQLPQKRNDESGATAKTRPRPRTLAEQDKLIAIRKNSLIAIAATWLNRETSRQVLVSTLTMIWGVVGILWFAIQGYRCVRFRRSLDRGTAAPQELQDFSNELARQLGLARSPTVWLMPGVMSPMLWGNGHSTLLIFPEQLLDRLDQESTGTLLTHELAHFRRRDHWVRVITLMVTGFFWWHPVVWWARREIEAVEEECCDALVLKYVNSPPKRYAEAILDTVDFLAELTKRLPPLATGLSQFPFLRQRLTWIMRGPRKQDLGYCGTAMLFLVIGVLPIQPTWLAAHAAAPRPQKRSPAKQPRLELTPHPSAPVSEPNPQTPQTLAMSTPASPPEQALVPAAWQGFEVRSHSFDKRFVFMSNDANHVLLDIQTGRDFDLTPYDITSIAFSPDSYQFATIDGDRFLRLWDAEICDFQTWQVPGGPSKSVDLSNGGRWVATGGRDGVVRIWSPASQSPIRELPRELSSVNCVRFSPDGQILAVATGHSMTSQSGRIALFNAGSWTERISMNWNTPAAAVAFNSDGQSLTSGDWTGRIARWSIETGELLGLLEGQKDLIAVAEFSPNGSPLIEIEIPDLDPNSSWGEPASGQQFRWFLDRWPLTSPGGGTMQATPASSPPSGKTAP